MAVTLTSTGITFSDGTSQSSAAAGASAGAQVFNTSGTWNRSSAGDPDTVVITAVGPGGGSTNRRYNYSNNSWAKGGVGGIAINAPVAVTGNTAVTVGTGGAGGYTPTAGNPTKFGTAVTANGGGGGSTSPSGENVLFHVGSSGSVSGTPVSVQVGASSSNGRSSNSWGGAGQSGAVVVVW